MLCLEADIISFATNRSPPQGLDAQLAKEHSTDNSSVLDVGRRLLPSTSIVDEQQCSHSSALAPIEFGCSRGDRRVFIVPIARLCSRCIDNGAIPCRRPPRA